MSLTSAQQDAVRARGNVLVVAGAGTGKTRTLVERCLHCLVEEKPPAGLDEILMVTFTDAAAAEMRQRIRARLEQELKQRPEDPRWREQLALFETAHIGTLHSFCLRLVREHFYELGLDPQLAVLAEEESALLAAETLDTLLERHYAARGKAAEAVRELIQAQGRGSDQAIRALVLRLHHYTQTRPDPEGWFSEQSARFDSPGPALWLNWLLQAVPDWRDRWLPWLEQLSPGNEIATKCAESLKRLPARPSRAEGAAAVEAGLAACGECPRGKKTLWLKPLAAFQAEAAFLNSLVRLDETTDPLAQDWAWVRTQMGTLLALARDFSKAFSDAKHELGVVDFHDLEQYSLRLLWDTQAGRPTPTALQWREKLRFVFVDEYQDINAAQDKIIEAVSRDGAQANRFLVGDVKQSIYRFRLADPHIFQGYVEDWRDGRGRAIPLTENFRSRERVLDFVNSLFGVLMRREIGGVLYDEQTCLRFGAAGERLPLSTAADAAPCVELHLRVKGNTSQQDGDEETAPGMARVMDLDDADKEARLVALRLRELKARQQPVWDEDAGRFRPVEWRDMAVLLRSPSNKAESYAKEFSDLKVPLLVERGGFYESLEITDLLSLLQMLDNPLQDLPVLAVLRSPLVGLRLDELAAIRLVSRSGRFWTALVRWAEKATSEPASPDTLRKVSAFLERFGRWRRLARQGSLARCLEAVLSETHYAAWLLTQPRGEQRHANVRRLLSLAQQFDRFLRQGLFRFLDFIEAQRSADAEPEVGLVTEEDAVRLLSIHQSKGLEFPVVVVADLGKPFNLSDLRSDVILDEAYGLCPQIKPPHTGQRYPSLPYWLACQRQDRELRGEEMRLLYVAMTRARDRLILTGSVSPKNLNEVWREPREAGTEALVSARSFSDWLGLWLGLDAAWRENSSPAGGNAVLSWAIHDDVELLGPGVATPATSARSPVGGEPDVWRQLQQRLSWKYPFMGATRQPAKTSVSVLRRQAASLVEEEAAVWFEDGAGRSEVRPPIAETPVPVARPSPDTAADVGRAHHRFLQLVSLDRATGVEALRQEAQRLRSEGALTADEIAVLDFTGLAAFGESDVGRAIRAQSQAVRRELAFTARFSPQELAALVGGSPEPGLDDEFVVVQGVADLAVLRPEEIWLLDFKTGRFAAEDEAERVKAYEPQLKLYARALSRIYHRPVTRCWLYFLAGQKAVALKAEAPEF